MSEDRYLDGFMDSIKESEFEINKQTKDVILCKTHKKLKARWFSFKNIAAACLFIILVSALIPNTPVNALCHRLFSFIPGVGVMQSSDQSDRIKSVLQNPVMVTDGEEFVEIKAAYIIGNTLIASVKTNVGTAAAKGFETVEEFKKYYGSLDVREVCLLTESGKVRPGSTVQSGPAYQTGIYLIDASFFLKEEISGMQNFKFQIDGFGKEISINMSPAKSGVDPGDMGSMLLIGDIMVFANINREDALTEVLLSSVAPEEYKNIRFETFKFEREIYQDNLHILDTDGTRYEPNSPTGDQRSGSTNTFYFEIPQDKEGLKLVIPHVLYDRENDDKDITINMPKGDRDVIINEEIDLGEISVLIERASIIPAGDPMLSDSFKQFDCLKIDASAKPKGNTDEIIRRVLPFIRVPDGVFGFTGAASGGTVCNLWSPEKQSGYSISYFRDMDKTDRIQLHFEVECAMTGPWQIKLQ